MLMLAMLCSKEQIIKIRMHRDHNQSSGLVFQLDAAPHGQAHADVAQDALGEQGQSALVNFGLGGGGETGLRLRLAAVSPVAWKIKTRIQEPIRLPA